MNYAHITEEFSHDIRDASLDETRFIFEDPHQPWASRGRISRVEVDAEELLNDFNYVGSRDHY
jgi:hypothetical protein